MKHSDASAVLSICDVLVGTSPSTSSTTTAAANEPVQSVTTMQQHCFPHCKQWGKQTNWRNWTSL